MKKFEFTIEQLRNLFIAGGEFEKDTIDFDMGETAEVTALDFGDYLKQVHNIDVTN